MRFINPNWYLSLLLGFVLFYIVRSKYQKHKKYQPVMLILSVLLFLVTLLFPMSYIGDYLTNISLYTHFRTLPFVEVLIVFAVPLFACLSVHFSEESSGKIAARKNKMIRRVCLGLGVIYISSIYIKPVIRPINTYGAQERWLNDVCMQSSSSTCGPACLATIIHSYGPSKQEMEIAKHTYSCGSGTEIWYLLRYAKKLGFDYQLAQAQSISEVRTPAILGVNTFYGAGHFITVLENDEGTYYIGDPLEGDLYLTESEFNEKYQFTGFAVSIYQE